jgi:hypothetical protein
MAREQKDDREKNPPTYRSKHVPRAANGENEVCDVSGEKPAAPSSAAESRTKDERGCTEKRPLTASKDEHEKSIG